MSKWQYNRTIDINEWFGFIYIITNRLTNQKYIGKKQFFSITRKTVKGRKNKKRIIKESKWETYTGSSVHLNKDIDLHGLDAFHFEIVSLHETKGSLYYAEVELMIINDAIRSPQFYNRQCGAVKFIPPEPTPKELRFKNW